MTGGGVLRKDKVVKKKTRKKAVHFDDKDETGKDNKLAPLKTPPKPACTATKQMCFSKSPPAAKPESISKTSSSTAVSPAKISLGSFNNAENAGNHGTKKLPGTTPTGPGKFSPDIMMLVRAPPTKWQQAEALLPDRNSASPILSRRRRSTISLYSSREVAEVLSSISDAKKTREQDQINAKLSQIHKRVKNALEVVGLDSDEEDEDADDFVGQVRLPPIYDHKEERTRMQERNHMIDRLDLFEEKASLRKQFLTEVNFWFKENEEMAADIVNPDEMKSMIASAQEMHETITLSLNKFMSNGDKVVDIGKHLLAETSKIIKERNAQLAKRTKKERIIVYDDKTLLSDPIKWESSVRMIVSVMEDCQKMIKNLMFKNALKLSQRQFDYLMVASEKRYKDLDEKKKQCLELQSKLHSAKVMTEKMNKEVDEQRRKASKLSTELAETKDSLTKLKNRNMELNNTIKELNAKIRLLEEQLLEKMRVPTPPPPPPPPTPPEPEKIYIKVVDSSTELRLRAVEEELDQAREEIDKHQSEIQVMSDKITQEKEKNIQLQERIYELEQVPEPVMPNPSPAIVEPPPPPPPVTEAPADKEASYYKTLMAGLKNEYEQELEKVKAFVKKEKSRGEAGVRKLEIQHKEHLNVIHKDTIRILRAIVHMRDHMINCLHKENLTDQAQAMSDLGNLAKDKLNPEPKELLTTVVGAVVDYLHNMETILNNAFLALRMMMRSQMERMVEAEVQVRLQRERQMTENKRVTKDCVKKKKQLSGVKQDVTVMAKKLKKAKNKLKKYQKNMDSFTGDQRYNELLERYGQVIKLYKNMQKEMDNLQSDFHDTMERKLQEKETMVISKMKMEMKQQRIVKEEEMKLRMIDQKENLRLLTRAYEDNKISRELHVLATTMIKKTLEIPRRKLQNLFEQYITFRTVNESKRRVQDVLEDEESNLAIDTRREMEQYLDQLDGKFASGMVEWRQKMRDLELEKKELNKSIYKLFNELLLETGVLLVHPLFRDSNPQNVLTTAAATVSRQQVKSLLERRKNMLKGLMNMPDMIQGNSVSVKNPVMKKWNPMMMPPSEPKAGIVAPHMLVYEVHRPSIAAARRFSKQQKTTFMLGKTESFNIGPYNHLEYLRDHSRLVSGSLL